MRYRKISNDSYLLYSIGWNEKDEGGLIVWTKSFHARPTEGDWVWVMPAPNDVR